MQMINVLLGLLAAATILVSVKAYGNCLTRYTWKCPELERTILFICVLNGMQAASVFGKGVIHTLLTFAGFTFVTWVISLLAGVRIATSIYHRRTGPG